MKPVCRCIVSGGEVAYNDVMVLHSLRIGLALLALSLPLPASAYILPEDALENNLFLPPTHTEAPGRVRKQQKESADRRDREQEEYFATQHPDPPEEDDFVGMKSPAEVLPNDDEPSDAEILRTARMLDRIERNQQDISAPRILRGRAPVTDTGPATLLLAIPFLAAAGWTWRRAGKRL